MTESVLFIAPFVPGPSGFGGAIRMYHLLAAYAERAKVSLLCCDPFGDGAALAGDLSRICADVRVVRLAARPSPRWTSFLSPEPFWMGSPEVARAAKELAPPASLIHLSRLALMYSVLPALSGVRARLVLDLDESEVHARRRARAVAPLHRKLRFSLGMSAITRTQQRAMEMFEHVFVSSPREKSLLGDPAHVTVLSNGADVSSKPLAVDESSTTLLFVGHLAYGANVDAVLWFARSVLPEIEREVPNVRLHLVGRNPLRAVAALHDGRRIVVDANAESVVPAYRDAALSVVPLRSGGGTRLKILESFALGRPVVSTSLGAEGLEVVSGEHLEIADGARALATACTRLLRDRAHGAALVARARQLVERRYSWTRTQALLREVVFGAAGRELHRPDAL